MNCLRRIYTCRLAVCVRCHDFLNSSPLQAQASGVGDSCMRAASVTHTPRIDRGRNKRGRETMCAGGSVRCCCHVSVPGKVCPARTLLSWGNVCAITYPGNMCAVTYPEDSCIVTTPGIHVLSRTRGCARCHVPGGRGAESRSQWQRRWGHCLPRDQTHHATWPSTSRRVTKHITPRHTA